MKRKNRSKAVVRLSGDPILTTVCESVETGENIDHITRDMSHILKKNFCSIGLSANQAGYLKRIIILNHQGFEIMINPVIKNVSFEEEIRKEGCLSYPGEYVQVERHKWIQVICEGWHGRIVFTGLPARIIQHEIDHLNGICKVGGVG